MKETVINEILRLVTEYGYIFLFLALILENTVFVGLVMPGEAVLLAAAVLAGRGYLNIYIVFFVAAAAAIMGNIGGYLIGYFGGRKLLVKYGRKYFGGQSLEKSEQYFKEHGPKTVFVGRFAAGIRVFVAALAGTSKMDFILFLYYTVSSVFIWTLAVCLLGYFFGSRYLFLLFIIRRFSLVLLIFIIIIVGLYFFWRRIYGKE